MLKSVQRRSRCEDGLEGTSFTSDYAAYGKTGDPRSKVHQEEQNAGYKE
jgi:hypothetical protein